MPEEAEREPDLAGAEEPAEDVPDAGGPEATPVRVEAADGAVERSGVRRQRRPSVRAHDARDEPRHGAEDAAVLDGEEARDHERHREEAEDDRAGERAASHVGEEEAEPERREDELTRQVERDVDHDARARDRAGHAAAREQLGPNDVPADVERGEQLVDRFGDPAPPREGPERRAGRRAEERVPPERARRERRQVKERHPDEARAGRGERPRDLPHALPGDERREEREPRGQSGVREPFGRRAARRHRAWRVSHGGPADGKPAAPHWPLVQFTPGAAS